jgi:large subunit ribosomal protein L18
VRRSGLTGSLSRTKEKVFDSPEKRLEEKPVRLQVRRNNLNLLRKMNSKAYNRKRIHLRIRKRLVGTAEKPRLSVFRSNKSIYCQLIDDINGVTLASASSLGGNKTGNKVDQSAEIGRQIAAKAKALKIDSIVFDRGGYLYHGRVKALADGAREGGLVF